MKHAIVCALLLALGACASERWANRGGEVASRDVISECSQQSWARARYQQMAYPASIPTPVLQRNKSGTSLNQGSTSVPLIQPDVQEQGYFNLCMKEKGYDLVSVGPKP